MALPNELRDISKEIILIFLTTLVILFGYPLLFITLIYSWICKQWALKLARKDTKIQNILEGLDGFLAGQHPYSDPVTVLLPYFLLADKLDVPTVVKVLQDKVITPNYYPKLTQRIIRKFGYHFWYSVDNFKVENHVCYLIPERPDMLITRTQFRDILTRKLVNLPLDSAKSPWEILVVPNMVDDRDPKVKSAFILRVNHCLMDGYSVAYFLQKVGLFKPWKLPPGDQKLEQPKNGLHRYAKVFQDFMLLFSIPYHFLKMFLFSNDRHQFVKNSFSSNPEIPFNGQCTPAIPYTRLLSVKNAYGVTLSSLIITLFGQATWKYMTRAGISVPNTIHGLLPFPLPGHGDILRNHWSMVTIPVKFIEADPSKTLQMVEKEFQSLRNSGKPLVTFYLTKILGLFPLWLRPKSMLPTSTFLLTNFPGSTEPCDFFGCMARLIGLGGKPAPGIPLVHGSLSLAGKFWFQVGGPVCNLPKQRDADTFCESMMDTLVELEGKIKLN